MGSNASIVKKITLWILYVAGLLVGVGVIVFFAAPQLFSIGYVLSFLPIIVSFIVLMVVIDKVVFYVKNKNK